MAAKRRVINIRPECPQFIQYPHSPRAIKQSKDLDKKSYFNFYLKKKKMK